jgi:type IV pilus assembly protein PilM
MGLGGLKSFVGLDFGNRRLKAVEVVRFNGGFRINRFGITETPPGAVSKGVAVDPDALLPAIRDMLHEAGIQSKRVVTALGGQGAVIRELSVPEMPDAELEHALGFEAERYLTPVGGDVVVDYRVVERLPREGVIKVLVVAARKTMIDRQLAPLALAGLSAPVVECTPISMVRALASWSGTGRTATMYVDLGAEGCNVLIVDAGRLRLSRNIEIGGNALTRAIAEALRLDFAAAESFKEQRARILLDGERAPDRLVDEVHRAILPVVANLAAELRRSLDFYLARLEGRPVSKVIAAGGSAKLGNLAAFLHERLDVPVEIGNPLGACGLDARLAPELIARAAPTMAVAVGLALRGAQA